MEVIQFLKFKSLMFMLTWICLPAFAITAQCEEWQNKLQTEIRAANQCEPKHQACLAKEFGNPMRELDYCKKVFNAVNPWMQGQRLAVCSRRLRPSKNNARSEVQPE